MQPAQGMSVHVSSIKISRIKISDRFGIGVSFFFSLFSGCVSDKGMTEVGLGLMSAVAD